MTIIAFSNCDGLASAKKIEQQYFEEYKATLNSIEPSPKPKTKPINMCVSLKPSPKPIQKIKREHKYSCDICNFNSCNKKDFNRHILTAKHLRLANANENVNVLPKLFSCECGKNYKHISSLCKHKKNCDVILNGNNIPSLTMDNTNNSSDKESLILTLIAQNKELMNLLESRQY
jgi:hypothetical protein